MLEDFFSIANLVPAFWWRSYGITDDRYAALRDVTGKRYSIYYGGSEEALTLFILGNIDGWTQPRYLNLQFFARNDENAWNSKLFDCIRRGERSLYAYIDAGRLQRWTEFLKKVPALKELSADDAFLVFELELVNRNFNRRKSVPDQRFARVSFTGVKERWSQYDAALFLPKAKKLILIEAKLNADTSIGVKGFDEIPQVIRNLEVAFFITHHPDSQWKGDWDCHYLFLYPGEGTVSAWKNYVNELNDLPSLLDSYRKRLKEDYLGSVDQTTRETFERYYDDFFQWAISQASKLTWDELAEIPGFTLSEYLRKLSKSRISYAVLEELKKRFDAAGLEYESTFHWPRGGSEDSGTVNDPLLPPPPARGQVYRLKPGEEESLVVVAGVGNKNCRKVPLQKTPGYFPKSSLIERFKLLDPVESGYETQYSLPRNGAKYLWDPPPEEHRMPKNGGVQPEPPCQVVVTDEGGGETSRVNLADGSKETFLVFTRHMRTNRSS